MHWIVLTTTENRAEAEQIASTLVQRRLAACVQLVDPVTSVYRWKGQVEQSQEILVLIKTTKDQLEALKAAIGQLHSYDVPEIIATQITWGHQPYLEWMLASTGDREEKPNDATE